MVKQKIVHGHAWKKCTITYNKRVSKPFHSINYDINELSFAYEF